MRDAAKSWVAYFFIGLLIISFGIWGIADFLGAASPNEIAKVGGTRLTPQDFAREYRTQKRRAEEAAGKRLSKSQLRDMKIHEATLNDLVDKTAIEAQARAIGFAATDDMALALLRGQAGMVDPSGKIDLGRLDQILRDNDMTQGMLFQVIKSDLIREQLTNTLLTGVALPPGMAAALNHVRRERRVVQYLQLEPGRAGTIADPDASTLERFYKDNSARFEKPEIRKLTLLRISPQELAKGIVVSEEDIKKIYELRSSIYVVKEKRVFQQIRFKTEAAAQDGAARLQRGETFESVAALQGMKPAEVNIGEASIGDPSIPGEAFQPAVNVVTPPLKGAFGWVILRATSITPGSTKSLDEVHQEIRDAYALDTAKGRVLELSNVVEDTLGSGATLEEAVKKDPVLSLRSIAALTRDGKGTGAEEIDGLPKDPEFLHQIFLTESGRETSMNSDGEGGYYIARVDAVTPKSVPPLDAIRADVIAAWRDKALTDKLKALADTLIARGGKGESLKAIGDSLGISPLTAPGLIRGSSSDMFSTQFVDAAYLAKPGAFISGPVGNGKSYLVGQIERVDISSDPVEAQITPMFTERVRQSLASDIAQSFTQAARNDQGVRTPTEAQFKALVDSN